MVKFEGLICDHDEFNEPIVNEQGLLSAVFSFDDVIMTTMVDPETKYIDWLISARGFAKIWRNSFKRGERHIFEAKMAQCGILFKRLCEIPKEKAKTLTELNKKWSIEDEQQ